MDIAKLAAARDSLENCTPLKTNCGLLCGGACCEADDEGQSGILLFPGERELMQRETWLRILPSPMPVDGTDYGLLVCNGTCRREMRPLGCRIFPLTPYRTSAGVWKLRTDRRAWQMCPLMPSGVKGLQSVFVSAVSEALRLIASDPEGERFLLEWQALEESYADSPFLL